MCGCSGSCSCSSTSLPIGPTGATGASGAQGLYGGFSYDWLFNTSTSTGPSAGDLRFNNSTYSSVTAIYVSDTGTGSVDCDAFLDSLSNNTKFGYIRIFKKSDSTKFWYGAITAVTDNGTDHSLTVTYISSNGAFLEDDAIVLTFSPSGAGSSFVLSNNTTDVSTSGTGADTLMSYVVPANTLKTNEDVLEIDASYIMSGLTQEKRLLFTLNGSGFHPKVATGFMVTKGVKYTKAKITITRKSVTTVFITIDIFNSDDAYLSLRGYHLDEGTGAGTAVADLSTNALTLVCLGENYDTVSNTETVTQNQLLVKYFNK